MKEVQIVWEMADVEVSNLNDFFDKEQTPKLKADLDQLSNEIADWWIEQAEKYLNDQECTYEEKMQVVEAWKKCFP